VDANVRRGREIVFATGEDSPGALAIRSTCAGVGDSRVDPVGFLTHVALAVHVFAADYDCLLAHWAIYSHSRFSEFLVEPSFTSISHQFSVLSLPLAVSASAETCW